MRGTRFGGPLGPLNRWLWAHFSLGPGLILSIVHFWLLVASYIQTLPKAQRTRGLSSYHKSWSNFIFRISTKHHLQNLNQNLSFKILNKPSFRILTKIELHFNHMKHQQQNNDQTKIHLGFNILQNISRKELTKLQLQILPELQLQNLDQTFCSKSEQTFRFLTKPRLPNLQQIVTNTIIISNSYNINKFWVGIFTRQGHINKVY